jgi:hypothetical protein
MLPPASTSAAVIEALPLALTPPFERTLQPLAKIDALPASETALDEVPSARTQGCAEATGSSSDQDCALTGTVDPLTNSFANANGIDS